ncbi:MAG: LamG-like jellyroll fold domain-containing protein [Candidatus Paceibacterota bacterium]
MQKINAFTLIELLVVIAIIGILSALIVIGMNSTTQKASVAKAQVFANSLRNSLMADMVSEWKLDGGVAGNDAVFGDILDTWDTNNATAVGVAPGPVIKSGADCVSGNCISFDGGDDYVDFGNQMDFSMGTRDHTVSLWVKFDNAIAPTNEAMIRCGANDIGLGKDGYTIRREGGSNRLYVRFSDGMANNVADYLSANGTLVADTWYNIVVIFDRDSTARAYINAFPQVGTLDIHLQNTDVQNILTLRIGLTLDGKMDEVRIFHAITTLSQIQQNYFTGLNKLLANGAITHKEYDNRFAEFNSNYAKN